MQRRKEVAFSPIFFVAGTKLMVPKSSAIRSYRDLAGKTVVVTAGTTNEAALRTLSDKQKLGIAIVTAPDHAQSLETLASGKADAFATDDVLLYGFIATAPAARDMKVVGEYPLLRSLRPGVSARRSGLRGGGRARLRPHGERAAARRALQQMVPAPPADRRDAQPADQPAARGRSMSRLRHSPT